MAKKNTKFNVGDKVRINDVDGVYLGSKYWNNRDVTEVVRKDEDGDVYLKRTLSCDFGSSSDELVVFKEEFHAIEKVGEDTPNLSDEIEELKRKVAELESEVASLRKHPEVEKTVSITMDSSFIGNISGAVFSPNFQRKRIIEKSKKFVKDTERKALKSNGNRKGNGTFVERTTIPEYIINEDKRTVVVLAKGAITPILYEKGIAKCNPADTFNADIGKAIALGRAYGLDTSDFELAPQPDEVVPGMVTKGKYSGDIYTVDKLIDNPQSEDIPGQAFKTTENSFGWVSDSQVDIISDTKAEY